MTLRIDINEVGDRIEEALERAAAGEEVLVERAGSVVAEIKPRKLKPGGLRAFFEERERVAPKGDEALAEWERYEEDLNRARSLLNQPIEVVNPFQRKYD